MKTITHVFAVAIASVAAFFATPAGQALLHQYPILVPLGAGVIAVMGIYHNPKAAFKLIPLIALLTLIGAPAHAQTSAPTPVPAGFSTFSLTAQPIALPGNRQTVAGTVAGVTFSPTANFDLREDNIIAPGANLQAYLGGFNYKLPMISTKLNNVSPNLNGYRFQFYLTGSVGVDRISSSAGAAQHYAFLAGGGVQYDITQSGVFTLGVEVRYAKLPGMANNTAIVSLGPAFHF